MLMTIRIIITEIATANIPIYILEFGFTKERRDKVRKKRTKIVLALRSSIFCQRRMILSLV